MTRGEKSDTWGAVDAGSGSAFWEPEPTDLVCAGVFASVRAAADHGLVVLAMGLPYWQDHSPEGFSIWVESPQAEAVQQEFRLYDAANENWPPPASPLPVGARVRLPWFTPLLWVAILFWVFRAQTTVPDFTAWGVLNGRALVEGPEWWRPVTALFLHADLGHLMSNAGIGFLVLTAMVASAGVNRAWRDIALASISANVITGLVHFGTGVSSLGASTTVFAGLGWLTGHAVRAARASGAGVVSRATFVPLTAGLILLGWLGGGGDWRTDVIAHAAGFACGFITGAFFCGRKATQG